MKKYLIILIAVLLLGSGFLLVSKNSNYIESIVKSQLASLSASVLLAQAPSCIGCPNFNDVAPPPAYVDIGPKMSDFPNPDIIGIWANASLASSITVQPNSNVWLTWKSNTDASNTNCAASGGQSGLNWNGQSESPTGQIELGPITSAGDFTISCDQGSATVHVDVSASATASTSGVASLTATTGIAGTGTIVPAIPPALAVTLTANGQTSLNLPWTRPVAIGNVNSVYNYTSTSFLETSVDVAWSVNHPDAQCSAANSNVGYGSEQLGWFGPLTGSSGDSKIYIQGGNDSYVLNISCTWNGQTAHTSVPITVGSGGANYNGDVTVENDYHVTLTGNGQSGTITVPYGTNLLLAWSSNYPANSTDIRCIATGDWSWKQFTTNGQQFTGPLSSNKVYNINCNDPTSGFLQSQDTLTVYVSDNATPIPTPVPTPTPSTTCSLLTDGKLHTTTEMCAKCGRDCPTPAPTPTPTVTNTTTTVSPASDVTCDSTTKAIVTALGGCGSIDQTTYKNIYNACCQAVTKQTLLQMLDTDLANGPLTSAEATSLLNALNTYLSQ